MILGSVNELVLLNVFMYPRWAAVGRCRLELLELDMFNDVSPKPLLDAASAIEHGITLDRSNSNQSAVRTWQGNVGCQLQFTVHIDLLELGHDPPDVDQHQEEGRRDGVTHQVNPLKVEPVTKLGLDHGNGGPGGKSGSESQKGGRGSGIGLPLETQGR